MYTQYVSLLVTMLLTLITIQSLRFNPDQVYSVGRGEGDGYTIGPKQMRKRAEMVKKRNNKKLELAILLHRELDRKCIELSREGSHLITMQTELKQLKQQKLKMKDRIARLVSEEDQRRKNADGGIVELGVGGFGKVLFGRCTKSGKEIAIKMSKLDDIECMIQEHSILQRLEDEYGFPKCFHFGEQEVLGLGQHVVLVMDVLGPSMDKLLFATYLGTKGFSSYTVLQITLQLLSRLESLSRRGIVHGDIQPGNFLMGKETDEQSTIYLIDFGLSSMADHDTPQQQQQQQTTSRSHDLTKHNSLNPRNNPIACSSQEGLDLITHASTRVGTLGFASSRSLKGQEVHECDDLESLAFSLAYLLTGVLPWSHLENELHTAIDKSTVTPAEREDVVLRIAHLKESCPTDQLCNGDMNKAKSPAAEVISQIALHARTNNPDYVYLRKVAVQALTAPAYRGEKREFDWLLEGISWSTIDGSMDNSY